MAYASQSDIAPSRLRMIDLAELTSDEPNCEQTDAAIVTEALNWASGTIENYCRQRYQVPLQQTQSLTQLCVSLAVYFLYDRRPGRMTESVKDSYNETMRLLKDIAAKKAGLDTPELGVEQTPSASVVSKRNERVFDDRKMGGLI